MQVSTDTSPSKPKPKVCLPPPPLVAPEPETPRRLGRNAINDFLLRINESFDVTLPVNQLVSPEKRGQSLDHDLLKKIKPLFFRERDALEHAVNQLKLRLPPVRGRADRLQILDRVLSGVVSASVLTPHSTRREYSRQSPMMVPLEAPPSPTLAVKHTQPQSVTLSRSEVYVDSGSPLAQPRFTAKPGSTKMCETASFTTAITTANTSFATSTTANTSFMSDATTNTKASHMTAITSFDGTQDTDIPLSSGDWALEDGHANLNVGAPVVEPAITPWIVEPENTVDISVAPQAGQDYHLRDIPKIGMVPEKHDVPDAIKALPLFLAAEAYRIMRVCKLSKPDLLDRWRSPRTLESLWKLTNGKRFAKGVETDYSDRTLCGKLRWADQKAKGSLLVLELHTPRKEDSSPIERRFGRNRFLTVDLPDFGKSTILGHKSQDLLKRVLEMLGKEQQFLGRTWVHFHTKPKKNFGADRDPEERSNCQVFFFAVKGNGLPDVSFMELINFAIPLLENLSQYARKAFSRLDLACSRTQFALVFLPHEIEFVDDVMSNDEPDDDRFNDPNLHFPAKPAHMKPLEMTDGCGEVSL